MYDGSFRLLTAWHKFVPTPAYELSNKIDLNNLLPS